ncbi:MAG: hypothetical protein V1804_01935 [Patescibacteria group bacterium]
MEKENLPWWDETIGCMGKLRKCISAADSRRHQFLKILNSGDNVLAQQLVEIIGQRDFEKTTNVLKFLESLESKDLHILKTQIERTDADDDAKKRTLLEIQNIIYGVVIIETHGSILPESSWGQ